MGETDEIVPQMEQECLSETTASSDAVETQEPEPAVQSGVLGDTKVDLHNTNLDTNTDLKHLESKSQKAKVPLFN